jgi:5-methylcytosine-specific restriction endonuclease McrA
VTRRPPGHRGGKPLLTAEEKAERRRARCKRWRDKNKEKLRKYFAEYRAAKGLKAYYAEYYQRNKQNAQARSSHPDARARRKQSNQKNKAKRLAGRKAWGLKNPEKLKAIEARRRAKARPRKREADRLYRQQKPETYKAGIARAKAAKPDLYKAIGVQSSLRRRARKRESPVERVSWKRLRGRDGGRCHLCGRAIDGRGAFDHLIPIARGGAHAEWNLMQAHDRCNKSRGTKPLFTPETKEEAERYIAARLARYAQETTA